MYERDSHRIRVLRAAARARVTPVKSTNKHFAAIQGPTQLQQFKGAMGLLAASQLPESTNTVSYFYPRAFLPLDIFYAPKVKKAKVGVLLKRISKTNRAQVTGRRLKVRVIKTRRLRRKRLMRQVKKALVRRLMPAVISETLGRAETR